MNGASKQKIMIAAGEASGDQRGAELADELLKQNAKLKIFGIGGHAMRQAGVKTLIDIKQLSIFGFFEVIKHLPRILLIYHRAKVIMKRERPDVLLLIDNYGFNIKLAALAKQLNVPVLFYISPQVWASRSGRVKKIAKYVDHMAVVFPFEPQCYQGESITVSYVGHPLVKKLQAVPDQRQARDQLTIDQHAKVITLMPGSRRSEVDRLLALFIESAEQLKQKYPELIFLLPLASTIDQSLIEQMLDKSEVKIRIIAWQGMAAMSAADIVIAASGTATLEASLLEKPLIIVAKVSALTAMLVRRIVKVSYVGLCNLIADKPVVCEFLQQEATVKNITCEALRLLEDNGYRQTMIDELRVVKRYLGEHDAAKKVADIALGMMQYR